MTYEQIAADFGLWVEYMDPDATMTRDEFEALTTEQKIGLQREAFGEEQIAPTADA